MKKTTTHAEKTKRTTLAQKSKTPKRTVTKTAKKAGRKGGAAKAAEQAQSLSEQA